IYIFILVLCLVFSMIFSGAETAYSQINKYDLEKETASKTLNSRLIKKHYQSFGWTLATILFANNLVNIAISSIITFLFANKLGLGEASPLNIIISITVVTPILVIFGEICPKLLAKKYSYGYLIKVVWLMEFFRWLLLFLTWPFSRLVVIYKKIISEQEVKDIVKISAKQRGIKIEEAWYISKALELNDYEVQTIMVSKKNIVFVNSNTSFDQTLKIFEESGHSRLPIKHKNKYIGIVLLKDLIQKKRGDKLMDYCVDIPKISSYIKIPSAFEILRSNRSQMGFIKNNNRIVGIVTIEDIIEEIFGEIYDEHDKTVPILQVGINKWIINGLVKIEEIVKDFPLLKSDEDIVANQTIKQWVQTKSNNRLKKGYRYVYKNQLKFLILENNKNNTKFEITKKY
ncbi:MAG: DUF21 domain-containing protein, partial [Mycoplasma sp.]|nr:DUF21 domain-containing protein [Mycoplasma sp.]